MRRLARSPGVTFFPRDAKTPQHPVSGSRRDHHPMGVFEPGSHLFDGSTGVFGNVPLHIGEQIVRDAARRTRGRTRRQVPISQLVLAQVATYRGSRDTEPLGNSPSRLAVTGSRGNDPFAKINGVSPHTSGFAKSAQLPTMSLRNAIVMIRLVNMVWIVHAPVQADSYGDRDSSVGAKAFAEPEGKYGSHACAGTTRKREPCQVLPVPGKKLCRFHGGVATGPKTEAGKGGYRGKQSPARLAKPGSVKVSHNFY